MSVVLGAVGFFVALLLFVLGILIGYAVGKSSTKTWLEKNGCFMCQEKYSYRNPLED
jgi:hypothetical protein